MDDLVLCNMTDEEKRNYNFDLNDNCYAYKNDNLIIGYARINVVEPYQVYIFINEDIRGNGYGTKLFKEVLTVLKMNSIFQIEAETSMGNIAMIRILEHYGGQELTRYDGMVHYIVPIR